MTAESDLRTHLSAAILQALTAGPLNLAELILVIKAQPRLGAVNRDLITTLTLAMIGTGKLGYIGGQQLKVKLKPIAEQKQYLTPLPQPAKLDLR